MADPEQFADTDREIEAALSPESLGHLLLMEVEEGLEPLTVYEQNQTRLLDIQARHAAELQADGVLWRAYLDVTNFDIRHPDRTLLPTGVPFRAHVYRLVGRRGNIPTEVCGVRFTTTTVDGSGEYLDTNYDVPVYVNDKPRRGFGSLDIETISRQVDELYSLKQELSLGFDLAHIARPKSNR